MLRRVVKVELYKYLIFERHIQIARLWFLDQRAHFDLHSRVLAIRIQASAKGPATGYRGVFAVGEELGLGVERLSLDATLMLQAPFGSRIVNPIGRATRPPPPRDRLPANRRLAINPARAIVWGASCACVHD